MRGQIEKECLFKVKEFFFCYKERNFQMMRSCQHYELKDDNLMENIRFYIENRRDSLYGMVFDDIVEIFKAIKEAKENPNLSEFPDFIFEDGFIEHFEITSSNENRKGSAKKIDQHIFNKEVDLKVKEFNKNCEDMFVGERRSESWFRKDVPHSYENLEKSFKRTLINHMQSSEKYSGIKNKKIYMIEYPDFGIEMIEDIDSNPEYFNKVKLAPKHCHNYRLSKDKNMLKYLYKYKEEVDYIIMNYHEFFEIIKVKNIPQILKEIPYEYCIAGKVNLIRRSQINLRIGMNIE